MKRLFPLLLLVPMVASAQAIVRSSRSASYAWQSGPLITADANTVLHVYWRNGALVDAKGNTWNMVGTVPQVASLGPIPPGAGPFSDTAYYESAVLDLMAAAGDFSYCVIYTSCNGNANVVGNGTAYGGTGIALLPGSATALPASYINGASLLDNVARSIAYPAISCMGRVVSTTTQYLKTNGHAVRSTSNAAYGNTTVTGTAPTRIGRYQSAGGSATCTVVYEVWFSTTTPADALFTTIEAAVATKLALTWP
jgi:hypothetical protein